MHLARINTDTVLDLSSPLAALALSRALLSLEGRISDICENVKSVVPMIIDETYLPSAVSWRTDRCVHIEECILDNDDAYDMIMRWVEGKPYISAGECVPFLDTDEDEGSGDRGRSDRSARLTALSCSAWVCWNMLFLITNDAILPDLLHRILKAKS